MYAGVPTAMPVAVSRHGPCDPEVRHERLAAGEEDVLRLDVPVHHAALVRNGQRLRHGPGEHGLDVEPPLALEPGAERLALDVRHHPAEEAAGLAGVEERDDVGVLEAGGGADLGQEAVRAEGAASSGRRTLTATGRSCLRSRTSQTAAIPPAPSSCSSRQRSASAVIRRSGNRP
jgi:hypothetical protein